MMRKYLEDLLGHAKLLTVYQRMLQMYNDKSYDSKEFSSIVAQDKLYCVPMVQQLVVIENNLQTDVMGTSL
jgi:hypothetical protein